MLKKNKLLEGLFSDEIIAHVAHEANRALAKELGEGSGINWRNAPKYLKESSIEVVKAIREGRNYSAEEQHNKWMQHKIEQGWEFGKIKDPIMKIHPCLVQYSFLSKEQKAKHYLFRAVVETLLGK